MNAMCDRAEMFEGEIYDRTKAVALDASFNYVALVRFHWFRDVFRR